MAVADRKPGLSARIILAVEAVLIAAICYVLVRAIITFLAPQSVWVNPPQTQLRPTVYSATQAPVFNANFDAFHRTGPEGEAQAAQAQDIGADAPETSLNLKLVGIRYDDSDVNLGTAFLQTPDNAQKPYNVDDEVVRGVTLNSVSKDFVTLSLQGRLERLSFEGGEDTALVMPVDPEAQTPTEAITQDQNVAAPRAQNTVQLIANISMEEFVASHKITPILNGKSIQGYEIIQTQPGFDLSSVGLQSGDIIQKVGTTDLRTGQAQWARVLDDMMQGRVSSVSVIRGGEEMTVKVDKP